MRLFECRKPTKPQSDRRAAEREYALMLRCEGLSLTQIGDRLGLSRERARHLIFYASRDLDWAVRHSHFVICDPASEEDAA